MSKIFDIDFRKDTFIEKVNNIKGVWSKDYYYLVNDKKGKAVKFTGSTDARVLFPNTNNLNLVSNFTIIIWFRTKTPTSYSSTTPIMHKFYSPGWTISLIQSTIPVLRLYFNGGGGAAVDNLENLEWGKDYCVILRRNGSSIEYSVNGKSFQISTIVDGNSTANNDWPITLGNGLRTYGFNYYNSFNFYRGIIYDEYLNDNRAFKYYNDFLHSYPIQPHIRNFIYPKPTNLSYEKGLVAAYNMIPSSNGVLSDISGNGNDGTIYGPISSKDGMVFDGVDDYVNIGNIGNIKSIAFRIKLLTTTEQLFEGASNDKLIYVSSGILSYVDYDNAYINGIDTDNMVANQWIDVMITSTTYINNTTLSLGLNNISYGNFKISDIRFYSIEKTIHEAKDYHNQFASQLTLHETFNYGADEKNI